MRPKAQQQGADKDAHSLATVKGTIADFINRVYADFSAM